MRYIVCVIVALGLAACSLPVHQIGDVPSANKVAQIKVGSTTKQDVSDLLGSPTHITLFEKESWVYIESKEKQRAFLPPSEIDRKVVVVTFAPNEKVSAVKTLTMADGAEIAFDSDETQTQGKDLSVWEEMVGNFGRFPANRELQH